jgi:hypothetical protein
MHSCKVRKIRNEEEVIEELYSTGFGMLFVDDDVAPACPAVPGEGGGVVRTIECACVSVDLLQI